MLNRACAHCDALPNRFIVDTPNALSRLFGDTDIEKDKTILPEGRVMGALCWGIEQRVRKAGRESEVPEGCPAGSLWVPAALCSGGLRWGHESRFFWPSWSSENVGYRPSTILVA